MLTASQKGDAAASLPHTGIRVYNTLTKKKEPFEPLTPGKVGIYLCGPTVYKPSHIGHMVGPVIFDCIKRYLTYCGYDVTLVINITDIDDKLIAEARQRGISVSELAKEMTEDYMRNLEALGVDTVDYFPRATENIDEIIRFTQELIDKGYAYPAEQGGDVYFDVGKDTEYGKLSHRTLESLHGEGGEMAERKRHPADFALWKGAKPGEPAWDSPWGPGRPGWHIECSAMSRRILGKSFDIHGGGLDLIFPHHENEIAQSECCHGQIQAKYWLHNGLMQAADEIGKVGGRKTRAADQPAEITAEAQEAGKMGKSKGASAFRDLLKRFSPETIRFLLLSTQYRRPIYFSEERLKEVGQSLETFYRFFARYQRITGEDFYAIQPPARRDQAPQPDANSPVQQEIAEIRRRFLEAMDDDFNTGGAIGDLFELVRTLNRFIETEKLEAGQPSPAQLETLRYGALTLRELSSILGLFRKPPQAATASHDDQLVDSLIQLAIDLRQAARKNKDFATADQIRDRLAEIGVVLEDRPGGTDWSAASRPALEQVMNVLIDLRADARSKKDFATADQIRDRLSSLGIALEDRPGGTDWTRTTT